MIEKLVSQFWLQKLGWTLLHFLWQGTIIVAVYLLTRAVTRRVLSAGGRYAIASIALIAMVLAPVLTFLWLPGAGETGPASLPALPLNVTASQWHRLLPLFVFAWVAGVLAFSIRLAGGWRVTSRLRSKTFAAPAEWQQRLAMIAAQIGASQPVRLLVSSAVNVPTVIGWLRPAILIPVSTLTGLPAEQINALLAHELAHVRRLDYLANIAQSVVEILFFYHPGVWWISRQIRDERELCCDDLAVEVTGDSLLYASALARLETRRSRRPETALAASGGSLLNRVRRLLEPAHPITDDLPGIGSVVAMVLLLICGAGVAVMQAEARPQPKLPVALIDDVSYVKPNPFAAAVGGVKSGVKTTMLFDPFLSAQLAIAPETAAHGAEHPAEDGPNFDLADVRTSPSATGRMEGGFYGGNRFDVQSAEMLDLISIAYNVNTKKILGGPAWLETDRFDVSALAPANSTPTTMRLMLRTLLAKRFGLVVRNETRDQPAYALTAEGKPRLATASGSGDAGCKLDSHRSPAEPPATTPSLTFAYTCRAMTMEGFAKHLEDVSDRSPAPILDETGWKGDWDFNLRFTFHAATRMAELRDALAKQLGLKLEPRMAPAPVLAVVNVNRTPLPDAAGEAEKLVARYPKQFDVVTLRPSQPGTPMRGGFKPGGLVMMEGVTLRYLILTAWNLGPAELAEGPGFLDSEHFDLNARVPESAVSDSTIGEQRVNVNALRLMLRSLLADRFGLKTHFEDRPLPAFTLTASKPNMTQADPAHRTGFHQGPLDGQKDPRVENPAIANVVTCQNMTMAEFAHNLPMIAGGYFAEVTRHVFDETGLDGAYDFTIAFSAASAVRRAAANAGGDTAQAPEPNGQVTLADAVRKLGLKLEKQKHPAPVLVIDQVNEKPTGN